jgi:hypothetical protein
VSVTAHWIERTACAIANLYDCTPLQGAVFLAEELANVRGHSTDDGRGRTRLMHAAGARWRRSWLRGVKAQGERREGDG